MKTFAHSAIAVAIVVASHFPDATRAADEPGRKHIVDKNYRLGEQRSAYVGEEMVRVKDYWEVQSTSKELRFDRAARFKIPPFLKVDVPAGQAVVIVGTSEVKGGQYRLAQIQHPSLITMRYLLNDDGSFQGSVVGVLGQRIEKERFMPNPRDVKVVGTTTTSTDTSSGQTNFELVYGGTDGDSISVLYREYTPNDHARPAFSQALTYSLKAKTIRYRDIQITVADATNEQITFTVTADGT